MAEASEFRLEADQLQKVSDGLRDVESRMSAIVSTLRGQLTAQGTPWQFSGAPAGIPANLEKLEDAMDPSHKDSIGAAVPGLAKYLDTAVQVFTEQDSS